MAGTNRGAGGTGRTGLDVMDRIALVTVTAGTLVATVVNALTVSDDLAEAGAAVDAWEPWVWELTNALFWIMAAMPLLRLLRRLRPPHLG